MRHLGLPLCDADCAALSTAAQAEQHSSFANEAALHSGDKPPQFG